MGRLGRIRCVVVAAAVVAVVGGASTASTAPAATAAAFNARFAGRLDVLLRPTGYQAVAWATGTGTRIGQSVFLATGPAFLGLVTRVGACPKFSGVFSITAESGDKIFGVISKSKGCRTSLTGFRSAGTVRILGGTGAFGTVAGQLRFRASANANGLFSLALSGTL
jgi:hypothetical protein